MLEVKKTDNMYSDIKSDPKTEKKKKKYNYDALAFDLF